MQKDKPYSVSSKPITKFYHATMGFTSFQNRTPAEIIVLGSLLFLILFIPFDEGGNDYVIQGITQVVLLFCGIIWSVHIIRRGEMRLIFDRIDWIILGSLVWLLVSLGLSEYKYTTLLELIKIASYLAVFYLCRTLFPLKRLQSLLLVTIFSSSVVQMAVAWYFYLSQHTRMLQADFVNPNNLACFLVFGINIGLSYILFARPQKNQNYLIKIVVGLLLSCLVITILAIKSRGAVVSLAATGLILTTFRNKKIGLIFVLLGCLALFLPISGESIFHRLQKRDDPFAYERIGIWKSSLKMAFDHPISGVGLGMYGYYSIRYNFPVEHSVARYGKKIYAAHNDLLQIMAELGSVGLALFLGAIGMLGYYSMIQLRNHPPAWSIVAASASMLGLLIQDLFSNPLLSPALAIIGTVCGVILIDGAKRSSKKTLTFQTSWLWYLLTLLVGTYIFIYVIAYPLLGHISLLQYHKFMAKNDIEPAFQQLQAAINFVPTHPNYHYSLGILYLKAFRNAPTQKTFQEGENAFKEAIRFNPRNYQYYESLATLYKELFYTLYRNEQTARAALDAYQRALYYNPFNPFLRFSMATLHADLNEFDQALELLRQAVITEPNFVGGHQMLGKMLSHLNRESEAEAAFHRAEEILQQHRSKSQESDYISSLLRPL